MPVSEGQFRQMQVNYARSEARIELIEKDKATLAAQNDQLVATINVLKETVEALKATDEVKEGSLKDLRVALASADAALAAGTQTIEDNTLVVKKLNEDLAIRTDALKEWAQVCESWTGFHAISPSEGAKAMEKLYRKSEQLEERLAEEEESHATIEATLKNRIKVLVEQLEKESESSTPDELPSGPLLAGSRVRGSCARAAKAVLENDRKHDAEEDEED